MRHRLMAILFAGVTLSAAGCQETIRHATMDPEFVDYGVIEIGGEATIDLTLSSLSDADVYVYFLAPSTFAADLVPAGDDMGEPFDFGDEPILLAPQVDEVLGVHYTCWAQDRGSFRWEISAMSSQEPTGYWNSTREVGTLVLKGSCGDTAN
jgi:hypothetical protein